MPTNEPKNSLGIVYRSLDDHIVLAKNRNEQIAALQKEKESDKESLKLLADKIKELEKEL